MYYYYGKKLFNDVLQIMHRNLLSLFDLVLLHFISNRSAFVEDFKFPEQDDKEIASEQAFVGGADGIELKSRGCKWLK